MPTFIPARGRTQHLAGACVNRIGKDLRCNNGKANQDGNGESIVSWGLAIQTEIAGSECVEQGSGG